MLLTLMCAMTIFVSCGDDDDDFTNDNAKAYVNITVQSGGKPQSGITVYMFDSQTAKAIGFSTLHSRKSVATGSDGVARFELGDMDLDIIDSQTTLYFVTFTKDGTGKEYQNQAAITIKKGETKSATINIGGTTTYNDNGGTNNNGGSTENGGSGNNDTPSNTEEYSVQEVVKQNVLTVHSVTYTGADNNRTYIPVQLPANTISWYYSVSSNLSDAGTPTLGLLAGLVKIVDPSLGLVANGVSKLQAPTGTADCNVYLIKDTDNLNTFLKKNGTFTCYAEGTRKNINSGIVDVNISSKTGVTWYLGLENPDLKDAINVTIEVVAVVKKSGVNTSEGTKSIEAYGVVDCTLMLDNLLVTGAPLYFYDISSFDSGKEDKKYSIGYSVTDDNGKMKVNVPVGSYYIVYWVNNDKSYYKHAVDVKENQTTTATFSCKGNNYGTLTLYNYSGVTYACYIDGVAKGYVDNYETLKIEDLALNTEHTLEIYKYYKEDGTYSKITKTTQKFTFTKAGEKQTYYLPKLATVTVKHSSTSTYKVAIDDFLAATWTKSGTYSFEVSPNVEHKLYVEQQDGYLFNATYGTRKFTLAPGESVTYSGPNGNAIAYFK
ncbi:MAG: hypothetical protein J6T70_07930 [Bacteroidales bacterium]|nr:hypothetical protein [Bacteroidales bacterium]